MSDNGNDVKYTINTIGFDVVDTRVSFIQEVSYGPVPAMCFCAVTYVPFSAEVTFDYVPKDKFIEFESFDTWLGKEIPTEPHTIESLCLRIFLALAEVLGDIPLAVTVTATTTVHGPAETQVSSTEWRT